jgi:hypothetical protein
MNRIPSKLKRWRWYWFAGGAGAAALLYYIFLWPQGNPGSPYDLTPYGTLVRGHIPNSTVTLSWAQPGVMRTLSGPNTGRASRFVICIYPSDPNTSCMLSSGTFVLRESHDASAIPHTDAVTISGWGSLAAWVEQQLNPRYRYTLDVTLPPTALDVPLQWAVGACKTTNDATCTYASPQTIALTARDLHINRINFQASSTDSSVTFEDDIVNEGETSNESFALDTRIWEVIRVPQPPSAQTDVNAAGVDASDVVVTINGEEHPVSDYRSGMRPAAEVLGIHKPAMAAVRWTRTVGDVPSAGNPLPAEVPPCANDPCTLNTTTRPTILAGWAKAGDPTTRWEFDSTDNVTHRTMRAN